MKKTKKHEQGSALFVTIMITSVVLILAMILLERIIPYAKQIRGMQESLQAYYSARGQVELGTLNFKKQSGVLHVSSDPVVYDEKRISIDPDGRISGANPIVLKMPDINKTKLSEYVVIAGDAHLPIGIHLFENDDKKEYFGTNPGEPSSHQITSFGGGVTFDLSGVNTNSSFSLKLENESSIDGKIPMEFVYSTATDENPFFGNIDLAPGGVTDLMNTTNSEGKKLSADSAGFLASQNCQTAHCAMKIRVSEGKKGGTPISSFPFTLTSNSVLPDLNAILVADGLSDNALYHARIIELIPSTQSL